MSDPPPSTTLYTRRLRIYMVDPANDADCAAFCNLAAKHMAARGKTGPSTTVDDVKRKTRLMAPQPEICALAPPPVGMLHLFELLDAKDLKDGASTDLTVPIGLTSLATRPGMPCPDIGYAVMLEYEGKGYAFEAVSAVLRFWQESIGVKQIFAATRDTNVRSQELAKRLGFVRGGELLFASDQSPNAKIEVGSAYVLPGMQWQEGQVMIPDPSTGPPIKPLNKLK